jgi:hypothetical protein
LAGGRLLEDAGINLQSIYYDRYSDNVCAMNDSEIYIWPSASDF